MWPGEIGQLVWMKVTLRWLHSVVSYDNSPLIFCKSPTGTRHLHQATWINKMLVSHNASSLQYVLTWWWWRQQRGSNHANHQRHLSKLSKQASGLYKWMCKWTNHLYSLLYGCIILCTLWNHTHAHTQWSEYTLEGLQHGWKQEDTR